MMSSEPVIPPSGIIFVSNDNDKPFDINESEPTTWFEPLYAGANVEGDGVPWAAMAPHPAFTAWLSRNSLEGKGKSALVVGCGMGDDAIELEALGFQVTAFDVAESAIGYCKERFPDSSVDFQQADLLVDQPQWRDRFDFVLEIYTVQALPPRYEQDLIRNIAGFVAPEGQLLVIAETMKQARSMENGPPWMLTPQHVEAFESCGLSAFDRHVEPGVFDGKPIESFTTAFVRPMA